MTTALNIEAHKARLPLAQLETIWEEEQKVHGLETYGKTGKYLRKVNDYLGEKIQCYKGMGLDKSQGKKIMDLGTGVGYFPWICDHYGHDCDYADYRPMPFYLKSWKILGLKGQFTDLGIFGQKHFTLPSQYDIITAHRTVFDIFDYHWYIDEWKFFFRNCAEHLKEDGFLFIKTNLVQGAHLHTPHPVFMEFIKPYLHEGYNSITFKITKQQILTDLA